MTTIYNFYYSPKQKELYLQMGIRYKSFFNNKEYTEAKMATAGPSSWPDAKLIGTGPMSETTRQPASQLKKAGPKN